MGTRSAARGRTVSRAQREFVVRADTTRPVRLQRHRLRPSRRPLARQRGAPGLRARRGRPDDLPGTRRHPRAPPPPRRRGGRHRHVGHGWHRVGDRIYDIAPGDVVFVPRNTAHSACCTSDDDMVIIWVLGGVAVARARGVRAGRRAAPMTLPDRGRRRARTHSRRRRRQPPRSSVGANGDVGAFTERVRRTAARRRGRPPAAVRWHGVPVAVKELFDVEGADGSYGSTSSPAAAARPTRLSSRRLRSAGAVVVGHDAHHEFGWGITTQHASDAARHATRGTSPASPAGRAVARPRPSPPGWCRWRSPATPAARSGSRRVLRRVRAEDDAGPHLRAGRRRPGTVVRHRRVRRPPAGAARRRPSPRPAAPTPPTRSPSRRHRWRRPSLTVADLRVGVADSVGDIATSPERSPPLEAVVDALAGLGARVVDVDVPDGRDVLRHLRAAADGRGATTSTDAQLGTYPARADDYGPDVRHRLELAERGLVGRLPRRRGQRPAWPRRVAAAALESVDVLVSPRQPVSDRARVDDPERGRRRWPVDAAPRRRDAVAPCRRTSPGCRRSRCRPGSTPTAADRRPAHRPTVERADADRRRRGARARGACRAPRSRLRSKQTR